MICGKKCIQYNYEAKIIFPVFNCWIVFLLLIFAFNYFTLLQTKKYILSAETAAKKLRRMALEVFEQNYDAEELVLIGIKENGYIIANKISDYLKEVFTGQINIVALGMDKKKLAVVTMDPELEFSNKTILLIDDVANSGRTMLYALQPLLMSFPKKIQTLALVERTHKSFPIALDYIGLSISSNFDEHINVEVINGEVTGAWMEE
jgi:pyrimidine operon attenuation protein/uracil phosphoribosyltransferase